MMMAVVVTPLVSPDTESTCTATENTNTSFNPKRSSALLHIHGADKGQAGLPLFSQFYLSNKIDHQHHHCQHHR